MKVLLVDDHELIRHGLRRAFERADDWEVVAEAGTLATARTLLAGSRPDVVVCDVRLPDGSGIDLVREVRGADRTIGIVVLTMYSGDDQVLLALEAGASAFVNKDAPADDVVAAARHAATNPAAFSANDLAGVLQRRLAEPATPRLSPRELPCVNLPSSDLV